MKKVLATSGLSFLLAIGLAACGGDGEENGEEGDTDNGEGEGEEQASDALPDEEMEMPEPDIDLDDVPDPVAEVNEEQIGKEAFEEIYTMQVEQLAQTQMMDITEDEEQDQQVREQIANLLVEEELLLQEANDRGIEVSDEDMNETIEELAGGMGQDTEAFYEAMEAQGMSEDEVHDMLVEELRVEQLVEEEFGEVEISDEELEELYDEQIAMMEQQMGDEMEEDPPELSEMEDQLRDQAEQMEIQENREALTNDLEEDANIEIHV
ncbi:SurA N-terminal domain-containing protein [Salicibibacter kimchii]|uniref:peptidylprolyl isomerase n=1 Tax=Salicibibacter kimchii TaxID=2099786 RepID=A0A345BVN3_9BACI|nr:SurA N-terminal domain-containing protein [Salicibibacter kimchii]AXF55014.1 hypothetical protein DT065_02620 [Salicibibacter kimchii]